eukprot:1183041-Prorocentrum_minimum.AAC.1
MHGFCASLELCRTALDTSHPNKSDGHVATIRRSQGFSPEIPDSSLVSRLHRWKGPHLDTPDLLPKKFLILWPEVVHTNSAS